ncbi:MAG: hypothetical protein ACRD19_01355, partial [Terriglobia bacterium]
MKAKFGLLFFAVFLVAGLPLRMISQEASSEPPQVPAHRTVLAQQPASLAGSQAPLIPPTIATIQPAGIRRGTTQMFTIEGRNLAEIEHVLFDSPGLRARVASVVDVPEKARQIRINVDLGAEVPQGKKQKAEVQVTADASLKSGLHWFRIQTPLGTSNMMPLDVGALPEVATNPSAAQTPQTVTLPATIVGVIHAPGEVNHYQFSGSKNEDAVFRVVASQLGSPLRSVLTLSDSSGRQL